MTGSLAVATQASPGSENEPGFERVPPHDYQAEQGVLGGMLMSTDAIADVVDIVKIEDFYKPAHRIIFEVICDKYATGEPADPVTIASILANNGDLNKVGGGPYLHDLLSAVPTAANATYYARIVSEKGILRRLINAGTRVVQLGYSSESRGVEDLCAMAEKAVQTAVDTTSATAPTAVSDFLPGVIDSLDEDKDNAHGLSTGLTDLDSVLGGLREGQLIIVAARPGVGKSILAADFARHAAIKENTPTLFASLEMSGEELTARLVCAEAGALLSWFTGSATIPDNQIANTIAAAPRIADAPLFIDAATDTTITALRSRARRLASQHRARGGLGLVVVDYMQLMPTSGRGESRERDIAEISRGLKLLAKELSCPVVALSQLNRNVEGRLDKRPQLSDLRESGAIEQDADVVILMHREDYYDKETPRAGEVDLIIAKNRSGRCETVTAAAQLHKARIVSLA